MFHRLSVFAGCALIAALGIVAGCARRSPEGAAHEIPRNVRVMTVDVGDVTEYFEISGPVQPVRGTDIGSEESGTVAAIVSDKGARVREGDVVIALDRDLLKADLDAAEANLALVAYNHDKTAQLFAASKISRLEMLQSDADLARAQSARDVARIRYGRAQIKAPYAGLVADRMVEPGQFVAPGTVVARVIDPFTLKIEASVTATEVAWIRAGQEAEVTIDGVDAPREGRVGWVGFEADAQTGKFKLEIDVDNADLALRSGVIARARLAKQTLRDRIVVPRDAVMTGTTGDEVYVVRGNRAHRRLVALGPQQGLMVAVSQGLATGDSLVVRGQRELQDGSLVTVTETVASGDGTDAGDPAAIKAAAAGTRIVDEDEVAR